MILKVHTGVEYRPGELDMAEVARTFRHAFTTGLALEVPVNGAHPGVHESAEFGFVRCLVHDLGMFDFCD